MSAIMELHDRGQPSPAHGTCDGFWHGTWAVGETPAAYPEALADRQLYLYPSADAHPHAAAGREGHSRAGKIRDLLADAILNDHVTRSEQQLGCSG
jgi:hypothetical protein